MKENIICVLTALALFFDFTGICHARTADDYIDDSYRLIYQNQFEQAESLVQQGLSEYPANQELLLAHAEILKSTGDYEGAAANLVKILREIPESGQKLPETAYYHQSLMDIYQQLGERHFFSKELCLRIIYHAERLAELIPAAADNDIYIDLERKLIDYYAQSENGRKITEPGADQKNFQLPDHEVSPEQMIIYLNRAEQRIKSLEIQPDESGL